MGQAKSKVMPAHQKRLEEELERWSRKKYKKRDRRIFGMLLRVVLNRYGGRRHPVLDTFETLMKRKLLTELSFIPRGSVIIYISHQWGLVSFIPIRASQFHSSELESYTILLSSYTMMTSKTAILDFLRQEDESLQHTHTSP